MSIRRQNRWMLGNLSARLLFTAGMLVLPAYLLQDDLLVRVGQVLLFGALAVAAGKRLQWIYFGSIMLTITVFHLIVPSGAVIAELGAFQFTLGALRTGVFKAFTIVGMVFISLVAVRADLRLPGTLGALAGKIFWAFERIMEHRGGLDVRAPLHSADRVLSEVYDELTHMGDDAADTADRKQIATRSTGAGVGAVLAVVAAQWAALLV